MSFKIKDLNGKTKNDGHGLLDISGHAKKYDDPTNGTSEMITKTEGSTRRNGGAEEKHLPWYPLDLPLYRMDPGLRRDDTGCLILIANDGLFSRFRLKTFLLRHSASPCKILSSKNDTPGLKDIKKLSWNNTLQPLPSMRALWQTGHRFIFHCHPEGSARRISL